MKYQRVFLYSFGYELPPHVLASSDIEDRLGSVYHRLKLPQGRLELMSGIRERRLWDVGTKPSDVAALAGRKAIDRSGVAPGELECLIFTSVSRDMLEPASASFVHNALGLSEKCLIFDISNACLGFLDGMVMLANMIELGQIKKGLVVAGETAEELVESTIQSILSDPSLNRKSIKSSFASLTIGSGAVALVMGRGDALPGGHRLLGGVYLANTKHSRLCQGGALNNGNGGKSSTLMATDSEELLIRGVETAMSSYGAFLSEMGWQTDSIHAFFCHQVGRVHARLLFETLGLNPVRNFETLEYLGNVGSVSVPITMAIGIEQGILSQGKNAALLGIGSGINCLMLGVRW